jgi:hypothetical protein
MPRGPGLTAVGTERPHFGDKSPNSRVLLIGDVGLPTYPP